MKKILSILIVGIAFCTTGCNNDSTEPLPPKQLTISRLIGSWKMNRLTLTDVSGGVNERDRCESDNIYEFKENEEFVGDLQTRCGDNRDYRNGRFFYRVNEEGNAFDLVTLDNSSSITLRISKLQGDELILEWREVSGRFTYDYTAYLDRIP
ncbi:MAG: lipocalin family protein [Cytophagales bacterium]|jgi:hypothetical protein|nr:lipocalin family protein [Cytophagales bacterium]